MTRAALTSALAYELVAAEAAARHLRLASTSGDASLRAAHARLAALIADSLAEPRTRVAFRIEGVPLVSSLAQMLAANGESDEVCAWLRAARPGDVYDDMHGERVYCVTPTPAPTECPEVDEPAAGDAFTAAYSRADSDRSPAGVELAKAGAR